MNRQAVPAILLSVSIVSFFAIALYQRDLDSGRSASGGDSRPSERRGESRKSARVGTSNADRSAVGAEGRSASMPGPSPRSTASPVVPIPPNGTRLAVATAGADGAGGPIGGGAARGTRAEKPGRAIRPVSDRTGSGHPSSSTHAVPSAPARTSGVKLARAPFTIVGSGETISDVARRIYGSAYDADWLWRANRDIVSEPGAALSPGTVLRTPVPSGP